MFGLTVDKLLLIAVLAGVLIGPSRLPAYTRQFADAVRSFRRFVEVSRARAEEDMGISLTRAEWEALNPRQYDPRHLMREALTEPAPQSDQAALRSDQPTSPAASDAPVDGRLEQAATIRPGQKYLAIGSAAHPRRILLASLPEDDPRRIAAEVDHVTETEPQAPAPRSDELVLAQQVRADLGGGIPDRQQVEHDRGHEDRLQVPDLRDHTAQEGA